MKLLTKTIEKSLPALRATDGNPDAIIRVKFFDPCGGWTWYATEYDPIGRVFFGLVDGHEKELGYFTLDDLESIRGPLGLGIERDLYFRPTALSEFA